MADCKIAFSLTLILAAFLTPAHCGGTLELHLYHYYNRHGHDGTKDHCDSFFGWFKTSKCDPYFEITMETTNDRGDGTFWSMVKTKVYPETDTVLFGSKLGPSIDNPIKRHFARWRGRFKMEVKVMDHDTITAHDLMDTISVSLSLNPGDSHKPRIAQGTKYGLNSSLVYAVSVKCDEHYYGPSCTKRCVPRDDYKGHYTCTKDGERKCLPTWHDAQFGCLRRNVCDPNPCLHGGHCTLLSGHRFNCFCRPDYHGHTCEVRTKPCEAHDHCLNGGTCINDDVSHSHCKCPEGWEGHFCEVDKNECHSSRPSPCKNGGKCNNKPGSYSCDCPSEFTGPTCEQDVDECENQDFEHPLCLHNGTCMNNYGGFECSCPDGINGTHCEILHSYSGSLTEIERIKHNVSYVLLLLTSFIMVILFLLGLALWKRRLVAYHVQLFIKNHHKKPPTSLFVNATDDDDEPRLEFKNSVYETLDESEAKRESRNAAGSTNVAYISDDGSPESPRKRSQDSTETDLLGKAIIDSGDGYVQLPIGGGMNDTAPEMDDEENLKKLFDDPANFPPKPVSQESTQKTVVLAISGEEESVS